MLSYFCRTQFCPKKQSWLYPLYTLAASLSAFSLGVFIVPLLKNFAILCQKSFSGPLMTFLVLLFDGKVSQAQPWRQGQGQIIFCHWESQGNIIVGSRPQNDLIFSSQSCQYQLEFPPKTMAPDHFSSLASHLYSQTITIIYLINKYFDCCIEQFWSKNAQINAITLESFSLTQFNKFLWQSYQILKFQPQIVISLMYLLFSFIAEEYSMKSHLILPQFYIMSVKQGKLMMQKIQQSSNLKSDIRNFIQLLSINQNQSENSRRKFSNQSDKLSIIYSASQPQSSQIDKQNSHNSINNSVEVNDVFKQLKRSALTSDQNKLVQQLQKQFELLRRNYIISQNKVKMLEVQFEQQKAGTDQILTALVKMDETQKQLWQSYTQLQDKYKKMEESYKLLQQSNLQYQTKLKQSSKDIEFMKKLVLVANENYENLEKKCLELERSANLFERMRQQRSSPQILSKSQIGKKKSSCSPTVSDKQSISAKKDHFEQNYRRLVLRTFKNKAQR